MRGWMWFGFLTWHEDADDEEAKDQEIGVAGGSPSFLESCDHRKPCANSKSSVVLGLNVDEMLQEFNEMNIMELKVMERWEER